MKYIIHVLLIFLTSLGATLFTLPVSFTDIYFISTFKEFSLWLSIPIMLFSDGITALIAYKLSNTLIPKLFKREDKKEQLKEIGRKVKKSGWWIVFIAAATPFPYTLTIYAAGAVGWGNNKQIYSSVFLGKLARYAVIAVATYFGYKIDYSNLFKNYMNEIILLGSTILVILSNYALIKWNNRRLLKI